MGAERHAWADLGKRPALFPAAALVLGASFGGITPGACGSFLFCAAAAAACALALQRRTGAHLALLGSLFLAGAGLARWEAAAHVPREVREGAVRLEGEVQEVATFANGGRIELAVSAAGTPARPSRFRALLYARGPLPPLEVGQRVLVDAPLRPEEPPANPGQSDTFSPRIRRGLVAHGSFAPERLVPLSAAPSWRAWITRAHADLRRRVDGLSPSPEAAALYLTLAAGLRADLPAEVEESFAQSGLAHVLSVSGLHVAALALFALALARWLLVRALAWRRALDPRRPAALLALPLVWAYVAFTGWQPPAVRSAIMSSAVLLGLSLRRRGDALNSLALAAIAIAAVDPAGCGSLSLRLSFLAVLSLVLLAPAVRACIPLAPPEPSATARVRYHLARALEGALGSLCASAAVIAASVPLAASAFHRVSLAGLLANVVCLPLCGVLTGFAAAGAAVGVAAPFAAAPILWAGAWCSELLVRAAGLFARLPGATVALPSFPAWAAALYLGGLLAFALARGPARWLALLSPAALAAVLAPALWPRPGLEVTFLAVGNGDAVVLSADGRHALVDGGGSPGGADTARKFVLPFLRERGISRLELAALSHPHADHALGLASAIAAVPTSRVWLARGAAGDPLGRAVERSGRAAGAAVEEVGAGRKAALGRASVEVLGPPPESERLSGANDPSLVLKVRYGAVSFLLPGDIEAAAEEALAPGEVSVLKAAHHGSRTSSTPGFAAAARPRYVVFCVGAQNRFRFPAPEVVARFEAAGARCYRTDRDGAVTFRTDGQAIEVHASRASGRSQDGPEELAPEWPATIVWGP